MNDSFKQCLATDAIESFLAERMSQEEQFWAEEHLSSCPSCVQRLESRVTQGQSWDSLRANLSDYDLSSQSSLSTTGVDEFAPASIDLQQLLGPTDDPEYLGRLGRYEIAGMIGHGSAGLVLKGFDRTLNRFVAIKMLAPGLALVGASRQRFEREARAIAAVRHANVIEVYGVDEFRDRPYIVMQYFPDGSLQNRIERRGWMNNTEICRIGVQVARGLAEAHRQGIIHRDVKPANILFENGTECAVLSDFGLASVADEATMTRSGTIAGTPQFMSPEQARGETLDPRSDLFSLGCVMYAAATGHSPFRASTLMGVVHRVCEAAPRPIRECNSEIAPWLEEFVSRLLAKDRNTRFDSATEVDELLTAELAHLQSPSVVAAPKRDWVRETSFLAAAPDKDRLKTAGPMAHLAGRLRSRLFPMSPTYWLAAFTLTVLLALGAFTVANMLPPTITPTTQEESFFEAQAAYELAYEMHLSEIGERGDMSKAKAAHRKAIELGFNKKQSYFNLAAALSYEGNVDEAFEWLEAAYEAGFHNADALKSQAEFYKIRADPRYPDFYQRVENQDVRFLAADQCYFGAKDYAQAEELYRQWLEGCPNDEHAFMMLGASLLEQGKLDEAKPWNEKTRRSVLYCNFGSYNLGCIAALEGDADLAFEWLNYAAETGFTDYRHLEEDRHLESIRNDSRFRQLLQRMKALPTGR